LFQGSCLSGRISTNGAYAIARMSSSNDVEHTQGNKLAKVLVYLRNRLSALVRREALVDAYQHGDRVAADRLIDSLSPTLHRFLPVHASDRRHSEDL
jgi:hypothetical protein